MSLGVVGAAGTDSAGLTNIGGSVDNALCRVPVRSLYKPSCPDSKLRVLFIQGIASATCEQPFEERVKWLADPLAEHIDDLHSDDFLYYEYTSPYSDDQDCTDGYSNKDACWSLDNKDRDKKAVDGQAARLESYVSQLDKDLKLTIVAHSQGGVLATYTATMMLDKDNKGLAQPNRIRAIVTLDSPLGGITSRTAKGLAIVSHCEGSDRADDSPWDMLPGSAVINRINGTRIPQLYTVNAKPGYVKGVCVKNLSFGITAINDEHSQPTWQLEDADDRHLVAMACTHGDIWEGAFTERANDNEQLSRVVRFIECAIAELPGDCQEQAATGQ